MTSESKNHSDRRDILSQNCKAIGRLGDRHKYVETLYFLSLALYNILESAISFYGFFPKS